MLGSDPDRRALGRLPGHGILPPDIAAQLHRHLVAGLLEHDHLLDAHCAFGKGLVGRVLELHDFAAAMAAISGNQQPRTRILDTILEGQGGEAAEYDGMDGADSRTGLHRDHRLRHERQEDDDAVAALNSLRLQGVGEAAHFGVQFPVVQAPHGAGLGLEDDCRLVAPLRQVHVQAVVGHVELPVAEPAVIGCLRLIQRLGERAMPGETLAGLISPEAQVIALGGGMQGSKLAPVGMRGGGKVPRRRKFPGFLQSRFEVLVSHRRETLPRVE